MNPRAWLVVTKDGYEAVFKDRAAAERYAVASHGIIMPLYTEIPSDSVFRPPSQIG